MKQVCLYYPITHWADITGETDMHIITTDLDGIVTYVLKDGREKVRDKE